MTIRSLAILAVAVPTIVFSQQPVSGILTSNYYSPFVSSANTVLAFYSASSPSQILVKSGTVTTTITSSLGGNCSRPFVSRDGTAVVFYASPSSTNQSVQPYIAEAPNWTPVAISTPSNTTGDTYASDPPSVSDNQGTQTKPLHYVAFHGLNPQIKPSVIPQIFVWNESTKTVLTASQVGGSTAASASCSFPVIDAAGNALAFVSEATNLVSGSGGWTTSVFYSTLVAGVWNVTSAPSGSLTSATWPSISSTGQVIVFQAEDDVYKWTPGGSATIPYTPYPTTPVIGNGHAPLTTNPCISPDGKVVLLVSNLNFTNSSNQDTYVNPPVAQIGIPCTFFISLVGGSPWLESCYDATAVAYPHAQTTCELLQASYGSISNSTNGYYHGAFFGGQLQIWPGQTTADDIFTF